MLPKPRFPFNDLRTALIYLNPILFAVFAMFFAWEEEQVLHGGQAWQVGVAGLGGVLALCFLLSTLRSMFRRGQ